MSGVREVGMEALGGTARERKLELTAELHGDYASLAAARERRLK